MVEESHQYMDSSPRDQVVLSDDLQYKRRQMHKILMFKQLGVAAGERGLSNFYAYLWALNKLGKCCPVVRIPDTGKETGAMALESRCYRGTVAIRPGGTIHDSFLIKQILQYHMKKRN